MATKEQLNKQKARELLSASYQKTLQETQRNVEKSVKRAKDQKKQKFIDLNEDIDRCLDFLDVVDKEISLHDEAELNKVKRQFGEWNTNVHGRIQDNIYTSTYTYSTTVVQLKSDASRLRHQRKQFKCIYIYA